MNTLDIILANNKSMRYSEQILIRKTVSKQKGTKNLQLLYEV